MEEWKKRLKDELVQTKERLERLHKHNIQNQIARELDKDEISRQEAADMGLMEEQERAMREYLQCLELRAELNYIVLDEKGDA